MKHLFAKLFLLFVMTSCGNNKLDLQLLAPYYNRDSVYVAKDDKALLLPTTNLLPDSVYIQTKYDIAAEDNVFEIGDTKYYGPMKGDTISSPGDTLYKHKEETKYSTRFDIKDGEIFIISEQMLSQCQINLVYKSRCIFIKGFKYLRDRNNVGLDFYKEENGKYYYKAPLKKWVSGYFSELDYMFVIYNHDNENDIFRKNEIYFSKDDIERLLPPLKAYLMLQ